MMILRMCLLNMHVGYFLIFFLYYLRYKTVSKSGASEVFNTEVPISEPSLFNICPYDHNKPTYKGRLVYPLGRSKVNTTSKHEALNNAVSMQGQRPR